MRQVRQVREVRRCEGWKGAVQLWRRRFSSAVRGNRPSPSTWIESAGQHAGNRECFADRTTEIGRACERECWRRPLTERVGDGPPHDLVHERLLTEPHFGLGRMHVHVHRIERHRDEQMHFRTALLDRGDAVGVGDRVRDRPIADQTAIDEDVLRAALRTGLGQRRDDSR